MTQTFDLDGMGLVQMKESEIEQTDGGGIIKNLLKKAGITYLVTEIIDNWAEIKQGFKDGWDSVEYK